MSRTETEEGETRELQLEGRQVKSALLCFILLTCLFVVSFGDAETRRQDYGGGHAAIIEYARKAHGRPEGRWVLLRRQDLEQDLLLFQLQLLSETKGAAALPFRFRKIEVYDVTRSGVHIEGDIATQLVVELDYPLVERYAYDEEGGRVYHLSASDWSWPDFNNLMATLRPAIKSKEMALQVFDLWSSLSYAQTGRSVLHDELQLMRVSVDDARYRLSLRTEESFKKLWSTCSRRAKLQINRPSSSSAQDSFKIVFFTFDRGEFGKDEVTLSESGAISLHKSVSLCRFNASLAQ